MGAITYPGRDKIGLVVVKVHPGIYGIGTPVVAVHFGDSKYLHPLDVKNYGNTISFQCFMKTLIY